MGLPLRDEGVVIGVVCDQQHLCRTETLSHHVDVQLRAESSDFYRRRTNPRSLASCWTESGRKCDNLAQPSAGRSPEISPEDLKSEKCGALILKMNPHQSDSLWLCSHTRLNVSRSQFSSGIKMDSDEFALRGNKTSCG